MTSTKIRSMLASIGIMLLSVSLFFTLLFVLKWYLSLLVLVGFGSVATFFWKKLGLEAKKSINEHIFIILSGAAAFLIIAFVVYLLVHIFLLGKSSLSWTFVTAGPVEGLTEGGIFPAIIGTALLVIIMALAGVPIGTITAIYLTEYAKENSWISKFIRFAVNTLAGVPAIVFGLFGLGFFIGTIGKQMDTWEFNNTMSEMEILFDSEGSPFLDDDEANASELRAFFTTADGALWDDHIDKTKILDEMYGTITPISKADVLKFYRERNRPHWGQPALIWAALTMALLTLPVVIVSVEEAIKTVPKDLREASLSLGATKWMTIVRVVLPGSFTGILTGGILAVSRGAGEVAPILFTGAAYYLRELPTTLSSQFMELGYHIFVLTTQSTNVDATKPLLYATTFVLLILTFTLNFSAIFLRSRMRAKLAQLG